MESIKQFGYNVPIVIDKNNIIVAGHTRVAALKKLGIETASCVVVDTLSEEEVKKFRLVDNKTAEFAEWDFAKLEKELENLDLGEFGFDFKTEKLGFEENQDQEKYTSKTESIHYEPSGSVPPIDELCDTAKADDLIKEIENADIDEETKRFLKLAAYRHVVFNYKKIADFYANSDKKTQRLMERSALVIVDINDAIEQGYVKLKNTILSQYGETYDD